MIHPSEIIPDPKDDEIGNILTRIQSIKGWTAQKTSYKNELIKLLNENNYVEFTGKKHRFCLSHVGDSILYQVPQDKTGHLQQFRGQLIRIVCTGKQHYFQYYFMAKTI